MKRCWIIFALLVNLPLCIFADSFYYGGPARLLGLGGQSAAIDDIASASDSYFYGFTSAIFTRPQTNVVLLNPGLTLLLWDPGVKYYLGDMNRYMNRYNVSGEELGLVYWAGQDTAITVKPYAGFTSYYKAGGLNAEFAQRFLGRFSAALSGGYFFYKNTDSKQVLNKPFYNLSLSLLPETKDGWVFSMAAGNRVKSSYDIPAEQENIRIDAGASMNAANDVEFVFRAGTGLGYTGYYLVPSTLIWDPSIGDFTLGGYSFQKYVNYRLKGADADMLFRKTLGLIVLGIKVNAVYRGETGTDDMAESLDSSAGVVIKLSDSLSIPLEAGYRGIFSEKGYNNQGYDIKSNYYTLKLGGEYNITAALTLRFTADYTLYSDTYTNIVPDLAALIQPTTGAWGTQNNPMGTRLGIYAGAGYRQGVLEVNLGAGYFRQGQIPESTLHDEFKFGTLTAISDIKWYY